MSQSSDAENREREGGTEQVEKLESLTVVDGICLLGVCVVKFLKYMLVCESVLCFHIILYSVVHSLFLHCSFYCPLHYFLHHVQFYVHFWSNLLSIGTLYSKSDLLWCI